VALDRAAIGNSAAVAALYLPWTAPRQKTTPVGA